MTVTSIMNTDERIKYIIDSQNKVFSAKELISAAIDILLVLHSDDDAYICSRIEKACIMVSHMEPDPEDIIAIILYPEYKKSKLTPNVMKEHFPAKRHNAIMSSISDVTKSFPNYTATKMPNNEMDAFIMYRVCTKMFKKILHKLEKNGIPDTHQIWRAYELAKEQHSGQIRETGEPYIVHPLKVAEILAGIGVESNIIAAAILHDVIEDGTYSKKNMERDFGRQIASYVYAVTAVNNEYAASKKQNEYSSDKLEMDARTFERLVSMVANDHRMIYALYIKAADRIHNLQTIDIMSSVKKHKKTDETDTQYLPLFRKFNLNYFANIIEDLTWRTNNTELYNTVKEQYEELYSLNSSRIDEMRRYLLSEVEPGFKSACRMTMVPSFDFSIQERKYYPLEVYNFVKDKMKERDHIDMYINKRFMPLCDFDIILDSDDGRCSIDNFIVSFIQYFNDNIPSTGIVITDFALDNYGRFILTVEDRYRNVIRWCFCMRSDYITYRNGSTQGIAISTGMSLEDELADVEKIRIKLRNDKEIELPKGATVIDAAFAIHEEIGLTAKGATINAREAQIYNILHDGDKVIVEADTFREDGELKKFIPHVRISWLDYVRTTTAKKKIVKYLSERYEGEDPKNEFDGQYKVVDNISAGILEVIDSVHLFDEEV